MATLRERVIAALSPYVGPMVADTCVRGTALSIGKTADELTDEDLPALESSMRRLLGPVAPATVIDDLLKQLERGN
ncbi:MAG TPA: hypothetical protein DCP20_02635 [Coriobacteriia bacterium]|jgi:hypothetical protein|nr:MAG: hypothetical protein XD74_0964 [Actinobacteria bacterium 66_15]HAL29598.1 hypothetical protein [Coriobacteriia bacterium]